MSVNDHQVQDAIEALSLGVGAIAVAVFDDDRARIHASTALPSGAK